MERFVLVNPHFVERTVNMVIECGVVPLDSLVEAIGDEARGNCGLITDGNVVLWDGLSEELCATLAELCRAGLIRFKPVPAELYLGADVPNLPVTTQLKCHKRPHWLPSVLVAGEKLLR